MSAAEHKRDLPLWSVNLYIKVLMTESVSCMGLHQLKFKFEMREDISRGDEWLTDQETC